MNKNFKKPKESAIETRYLVMPEHTNQRGTIFGGVIMSWIDIVACMVAERHSGMRVVTVSIDTLTFDAPAFIGDHIILKSSVNYVGNTSMEIGVKVIKENPITGESVQTTTAHLTMVALDDNSKPTKVPQILMETDDEKRRYENAKIRVMARKELANKIKKGKD
ncbi:MAG TPA: acyl-CoA thioesterase [Spirochaetota bacterium]|nr:acyl-CoA thioesterase [Spirochaetota bacterium]